jgi:DNA-binding MarR family transcriptional regulator
MPRCGHDDHPARGTVQQTPREGTEDGIDRSPVWILSDTATTVVPGSRWAAHHRTAARLASLPSALTATLLSIRASSTIPIVSRWTCRVEPGLLQSSFTVLVLVCTVGAVADRPEWFEQMPMPALLRAARAAYGSAIREALADIGCDDMPRNGSYVVGAIARTGAPLGHIVEWLGVSKQAAGQLIDTLVTRGYLDRSVDSEDRRRLIVRLTERGEAAAAVIRSAVDGVDAALVERVGADRVEDTRATLACLVLRSGSEG